MKTKEQLSSETKEILADILERITVKRKIRKTRPKDDGTQAGNRAYYVWKMARFHGGADGPNLHGPMYASVTLGNDEHREWLDNLADAIAQQAYGSNMRAAQAWKDVL